MAGDREILRGLGFGSIPKVSQCRKESNCWAKPRNSCLFPRKCMKTTGITKVSGSAMNYSRVEFRKQMLFFFDT